MAKQKETNVADILAKYSAEKEIEFLPTGSMILDSLLGGGIATGAMYAFYGTPGSGKSTYAIQAMRKSLKAGKKCAFIDVEKSFNRNQQEAFKVREYVDNGQLIYLTADNYAQLDEICTALAETDVQLVVVDSETALLVALPDDIDVTSERPGQKARQASLLLQKVKSKFYNKGIASIWIFQARANITMGPANPYAQPDKMAGGYAQHHVPDVKLRFSAGQKLGDKESPEGQVVHLVTDKNKFAPPFLKRDVEMYFGKGTDTKKEIIFCAIEQGLIKQNGSFFTLPDGENVRGREGLAALSNDKLKSLKEQLVW